MEDRVAVTAERAQPLGEVLAAVHGDAGAHLQRRAQRVGADGLLEQRGAHPDRQVVEDVLGARVAAPAVHHAALAVDQHRAHPGLGQPVVEFLDDRRGGGEQMAARIDVDHPHVAQHGVGCQARQGGPPPGARDGFAESAALDQLGGVDSTTSSMCPRSRYRARAGAHCSGTGHRAVRGRRACPVLEQSGGAVPGNVVCDIVPFRTE